MEEGERQRRIKGMGSARFEKQTALLMRKENRQKDASKATKPETEAHHEQQLTINSPKLIQPDKRSKII